MEMDIKFKLADLKKEIDKEMELYFDRVIDESSKTDHFVADVVRYAKKIALAGGKRLRPALMYYGYLGAGGENKEEIIKTSIGIELIHIFLLIHDDIIDRDFKRHGVETFHHRYAKLGEELFPSGDFGHFGDSMGIVAGDMVAALGNQVIFESKFDSKLIIQALHKLQSIISLTVVGQISDVYIEYKKAANEEDVLRMYEYKTARYTVEGPLHLGAILGGAKEDDLRSISQYAIPIGIAFQIQDDILGIVGEEKEMGKTVGSDIQGGKQTLLVVKAKEWADEKQRKILDNLLGKKDITQDDISQFVEIISQTGSLEYCKNLAKEYVEKGRKGIESAKISQEARDFLLGIADYMIARKI